MTEVINLDKIMGWADEHSEEDEDMMEEGEIRDFFIMWVCVSKCGWAEVQKNDLIYNKCPECLGEAIEVASGLDEEGLNNILNKYTKKSD